MVNCVKKQTESGGGELKTTGTMDVGDGLWLSPNTNATNSSNFSGLPGGSRDGTFKGLHTKGTFWSNMT